MAILGVEVASTKESFSFWHDTEKRLVKSDLAKNPFDARIKHLSPNQTVLSITPVYPKFWVFGLLPLAIGLVLRFPVSTWVGVGVLLFGLVFWTSPFYCLMIFLGLKKSGHKGKIRFMTMNKIVLEMMKHGTN